MNFTNEQLERYSRQIVLKEVGGKGQEKLLKAKVLIIGAGGLGSPAALFLAAAGVGTIGLADSDAVELSNLQRQIIHQTKDIGKAKVLSAQETIGEMNPDVNVVTYQELVTAANILRIINNQSYDFVIDGTDNFPTKFLINDACVLAKKPFSHAGVLQFYGQTMTYLPEKSPCFRCVFKSPPPPSATPTCKEAGILGVTAGVLGVIQATEAIKYILGAGQLLTGKLLTYDALDMTFGKINLSDNNQCPVCGNNPVITAIIPLADYTTTHTCQIC